MICPFCNHKKTSVSNVRPRKQRSEIWRRRTCKRCAAIFTTHETPHLDATARVYKTEASHIDSEPFNIGILTVDIASCFQHDTKHGAASAYSLARTVEIQLLEALEKTSPIAIKKETITHVTLRSLKNYDTSAAMQYAAKHNLL